MYTYTLQQAHDASQEFAIQYFAEHRTRIINQGWCTVAGLVLLNTEYENTYNGTPYARLGLNANGVSLSLRDEEDSVVSSGTLLSIEDFDALISIKGDRFFHGRLDDFRAEVVNAFEALQAQPWYLSNRRKC